jgi:hypothetical protein
MSHTGPIRDFGTKIAMRTGEALERSRQFPEGKEKTHMAIQKKSLISKRNSAATRAAVSGRKVASRAVLSKTAMSKVVASKVRPSKVVLSKKHHHHGGTGQVGFDVQENIPS